ncbi:ABC transporter ATP-binding protein [Paenibacillus sp. 19GGS1-52]|uniref:ABC transporter ATP-binding protein n=1 Tax=Paenibacillus sp. 19GGS1-52 TaxID=2758563 RepID=UPI001EFB078A|nr:ABC transporter ATP-binding protein [Paenibacillus sp. 19GGS1-52]ULO04699.1 ABC transporter ATP-binding protein [Paenibacillus sp. 19GGS1-52]
MECIAKLSGLTKEYRNGRGIRNVGLELYKGDIYGLLGPNGAGKTTLLKMMTGLIAPKQGSVTLFGHNTEQSFAAAMNKVGCMIESADFYDYVTAGQYLKSVASFYPNVQRERIQEVLEIVGLTANVKEKIRHFSTGMKQKLALAAAIMPYPELVILDEPTNGLDIEGIVLFRELVTRLSETEGITFIISSHMIHELEQLCNRVGIIYEGELVQEGNVSELLKDIPSLEQYYIGELQKAKGGPRNV